MRRCHSSFGALCLLAIVAAMAGRAAAQAPLTVTSAWAREPVPGRPVTAAYAVVENPGGMEVQIVSASSDVAGKVELHEMVRSGDMMKMSPVKSIAVPAKGKVELKPGGLHIMLFELKKPLKDGDTIPLTLTTSTGGTVTTTAAVKKGQMMQ
jgi:copper(I)-binding protein